MTRVVRALLAALVLAVSASSAFAQGVTIIPTPRSFSQGSFTEWLRGPDGSCTTPTYSATNYTASGMAFPSGQTTLCAPTGKVINFAINGSTLAQVDGGWGVILDAAREMVWGSSGVASPDVRLARLAANTLGLRNGTATQTLHVGPASSYIEISKINGGFAQIFTRDAFALRLGANNDTQWYITSSGHLTTNGGAYNIGDGAGNSPASIWAEAAITAGANLIGSDFLYPTTITRSSIRSDADGKMRFAKNNEGNVVYFQFTGTPTCSTNCGTSPSVTGVDSAFTVTMGATGTPTSGWVVTFNGTWSTAPACSVVPALAGMVVGKLPLVAATTTTTLTVTTNGTDPANGDKYAVTCFAGA